ncbi:formyltransferase family protein [Nonomuraea antri]|uniref:formyltransferase family protein n=1 Tax=Nonomuraea antri TaxID=2730852 RepID=UPI001C2C26C5|nr:formyltransferase family protein [Nonomuraea antri]
MAYNVAVLASQPAPTSARGTAARERLLRRPRDQQQRRVRALAHAREQGIPSAHLSGRSHPDPDDLDQAMLAALDRHHADLVVTAGYLKKIGPAVLDAYAGRIINVHPALLPRHGGQGMYGRRVHESVLAGGDSVSGATVHLVTADYDEGPAIARRQVPVLSGDDPDTLAARVLQAEHLLLPAVVQALALGIAPKPSAQRPTAGLT